MTNLDNSPLLIFYKCLLLGNPDTVKRSLRRERVKTMPKNPASLRGLTLDEEWTITSDQEQFLIHDSGVDSSDRMDVSVCY